MKKIAILTQPLHDNYGGLLQAYALKEILKRMGHEVEIINRRNVPPWWRLFLSKIKSFLLRRSIPKNEEISQKHRKVISEHTKAFQKQFIPELGKLIPNSKEMMKVVNRFFDTYIVGSDQCWRPKYSPCIQDYFLDFAKDQQRVKRISYAASFGSSEWEFTKDQTDQCKELLHRFDYISVREKDGVHLVQKYFGRNDAVCMLDPTMLLPIDCYSNIINHTGNSNVKRSINVYMLDKSNETIKFVEHIQRLLDLPSIEVMPECRLGEKEITDNNVLSFQFPSPASWLQGFKEAEFVITDSFHGTVFSILFNKPFITVGNETRGMSRFTSILEIFDLTDRLVKDFNLARAELLVVQKIDWQKINLKLENEKEKALKFLEQALK